MALKPPLSNFGSRYARASIFGPIEIFLCAIVLRKTKYTPNNGINRRNGGKIAV